MGTKQKTTSAKIATMICKSRKVEVVIQASYPKSQLHQLIYLSFLTIGKHCRCLASQLGNWQTLEDLRNKVQSVELQNKVLEAKCDEYEDNISTLKSIVSKQQHSLSMIDAHVRECNVIVSGLSEDNITIGGQDFQNDKDKIAAVLGEIDAPLPADFSVERIGKESADYTRIIKLNVGSKTNRDAILLKSKDLKNNSEESVSPVYLKKDLHPVLVHVNNRLRRKMKDLQKLESNNGKEIKLLKGKLLIDNSVVDQNMLFA